MIWCAPIYRIFAPNVFKFKIILALRLSVNFVASNFTHYVLTFTFHCTIPRQSSDEQVKDFSVSHTCPDNLWAPASDGSLCINSNVVIRIPPKINTHFVITFLTYEGVDSWSPCPHLSMKALNLLGSVMILSPNCTLPIMISFDPKAFANNKRCSIQVRLVSV